MTFNSLEFLVFFPVVTTLFFLLPHKYRWLLLLTASVVFYMAFVPIYILILAVTIVVDYGAGILIERSAGKKRKLFLVISILSTVAVLFVFKYFGFFSANVDVLARLLHWNYSLDILRLALPLGLSFHTFQGLSYVIEVYRGRQKTEHHFGIYALYVMFYPQLVAGPIERPQNMLHQFYEKHKFEYRSVVSGLKLMLWGMFKKVVIADNLAVLVNQFFDNPQNFPDTVLVKAVLFFAIQIYCDFSGYSDIAIGAARVMGFKLMENFNKPYLATSVVDFWRRWNISLSSWFRDYLYIPLGGSRTTLGRNYFNIFVVFLLSGLWHGASWMFVLWGALHGLYVVVSKATQKAREKVVRFLVLDKVPEIHRYLKIATTFSLVSFAWIFFRAKDIGDAFYIIFRLFSFGGGWQEAIRNFFLGYPIAYVAYELAEEYSIAYGLASVVLGLSFALTVLGVLMFIDLTRYLRRYGGLFNFCFNGPVPVFRWLFYSLLLWLIFIFGAFGIQREFIYFAF